MIPEDYKPSLNEEFMNPIQKAYFRKKLEDWKIEILEVSKETINHLQTDSQKEPDLADRASAETDWSVELRTRGRQRKLVFKIDAALMRLEQGDFGYCQISGEPINLNRLEARPIATMSLEAQENHENYEKVHKDE